MKVSATHIRLVTPVALLMAALCASSALLLLPSFAPLHFPPLPFVALPLDATTAVLLLACIAALGLLEYGLPRIALALTALVALAVAVTIVFWVANRPPPFGIALFGAVNMDSLWFPVGESRDAAIAVALASLAPLVLGMGTRSITSRALGWATGVLLFVGPIVHVAVALIRVHPQTVGQAIDSLSGSHLLVCLTATLCGVALVASRHTQSSGSFGRIDWGSRVRATIVVGVVGITLIIWHSVRAAEIAQLQLDLQSAAHMIADNWQDGVTERARTTVRLCKHWIALDWAPSDHVALADIRAFLHDNVDVFAVAMSDERGAIQKLARRDIPAGAMPTPDDPVRLTTLDAPHLSAAILEDVRRTATSAIVTRRQVGQAHTAVASAQTLLYVATPAIDDRGNVLGALTLAIRRDVNDAALFEDVAPDFFVRFFVNGHLRYARRAAVADNVEWPQRFVTREEHDFQDDRFAVQIAPDSALIERYLTWTPALVLIFIWGTLSLITFALYSERRAVALARDRERILDESLDLICTLDAQGRCITVNTRARSLLGYEPEEIIGRPLTDLVDVGDRANLTAQWHSAQSGSNTEPRPLRFLHKDDGTVYLQGDTHWSSAEQVFYCDLRDVSAQHALELARQHTANTFDTGVEQAGCVVYEYDHATQQISWIGATRSLLGYEADEVAGAGFDAWMRNVHPDDRQHVRNTLERCIETQQPHTIDYRLRRKDGEYVPVLDRGKHVEEPGRAQPRMIGALIDLTAVRQQEQALRRSEERYRIIATQVGAVIIERDGVTGRVQAFGPVEQIFGYTKEQVESRPYGTDDTMIHKDDRAHVAATVAAAERNLSSYYLEYRRRHRGGHYIYIASRGVVVAGADGRAERSVIAITDITERKLAEERLQESEERFRLAAEQARQIVYEFAYDDQLRVESMRFAGAIEQLLGYSPDEFTALYRDDHATLFHPDDLPVARKLPIAVAQDVGSFQVEHRLRRKDGQFVYVENRAAARRDANGHLIGIVGMLIDISTRKAAETERQAYTAQLAKLADIARKVSTLLSPHDLLIFLARSLRELLSVNATAAIVRDALLGGERLSAVSFPDHYGLQRANPEPFGSPELYDLAANQDRPVRLTVAQTDADPRWAQLTQNDELHHPLRGWLAMPLAARDGTQLGLLEATDKVGGDFTDSDAQLLSQLAGLASVALENIRLYATLEERVAARTRELQLSNRELEAFSYSVSHDLRAPLRAIAGFSSILEQEYAQKLDGAARRYIQRIGSGVERMANLIDDLLSLARVSRLDLHREATDFSGMCRAIVKRLSERWPQRQLQFKIDPRMRINADPRLLEVAMENLIENAIKFTGTRDAAQIRVGKRVVDGEVAYFVGDNGVGFDPQYAANLFGVFQRLHSASEFPGTGVGLATVQRIVQRHRGRVWAESQVDRGATFYFTFDSEN